MVPQHIAIILDGNGRWAKAHGLPRNAGHVKGAANVEPIIRAAADLGVRYITFYAFSTENWNRPQDEVSALMKLLRDYLKDCKKKAKRNNMRMRVIGDKSRLDADIQDAIRDLEEFSKDFNRIDVQIAINYGSRDEIVRAVNRLADDVKADKISGITEDVFASYLDTAGIPDPDLLIRTSGEQRLSNYLLWQLAYAEFYFTNVPWPDFSASDLQEAIDAYENRDRRYGKV